MGLGFKLKELLEAKGIRIAKIADELGLPRNSLYSLIKRDSDKMDMDVLSRIAEYLDVSIDYFFDNTPSPSEIVLGKRESELLNNYRQLSDESQTVVSDLTGFLVKLENQTRKRPALAPIAPAGNDIRAEYSEEEIESLDFAAAHDIDGESPYIPEGDEHEFDPA